MSARSIVRAHEREQRRLRRRARRLSAGAAVAVGAGLAFAPAAEAATFPVTSNADGAADACDADCTLRDAITEANLTAASDTITFAANVTGEIELDSGEGALPVETAMSITGPGSGTLAVDGDGSTQLFTVDTSIGGSAYDDVLISGLTLRDGYGYDGAAIYSYGSDLTLDALVVRNNRAYDDAAVYGEGGLLSVNNSTFRSNQADDGAAIYTDNDYGDGVGDQSRVLITNSTFTGNVTSGSGGAIYIDDETDTATISGSTFAGNAAGLFGGGIVIFGPETGVARVENSTITGNNAGRRGGGVYSYGQYDRPVEIVNSTVAGNFAGESGGGMFNFAYDNPAYAGGDQISLSSTIVANNNAESGPDLANRVYESGDGVVNGTFLTGFSLIGSTAQAPITESPAGSNQLDVDPMLGALGDNGGPTRTILPALTSPAIDNGTANGLATDQRGLPRTVKTSFSPAADGTDIGAVELGDEGLTGVTLKAKKKQKAKKRIVITVEAGADEEVKIVGKGKLKAGKAKGKLKKAKKTVEGGETAKLKLKAKGKKTSNKVNDAIDDGKKGKVNITVKFTDPAGNTTTKKKKVKLVG